MQINEIVMQYLLHQHATTSHIKLSQWPKSVRGNSNEEGQKKRMIGAGRFPSDTAGSMGIEDGDRVRIESPATRVRTGAKLF